MVFTRFPWVKWYFSYNHRSQELIIVVHFSVRARQKERCFRKKIYFVNFLSENAQGGF